MTQVRLARELLTFGAIGLVATGVHVATALLAYRFLSASPLFSNTLGYIFSVGFSFFGNSRFTFRTKMHDPKIIVRYIAVSISMLIISQLIVYINSNIFGISFYLSMIFVVVAIPISNFFLSKIWTFRVKD